jgi:tetratricopeptide (TPR) repeat protein
MFKHRIKEWGLGKNYTAAERKYLAQMIKDNERIVESCPKELSIRGQPVKAHRIRRDCEREQLSLMRLSELHQLDQDMKFMGDSQIELEDFRKRLALSSMPVPPLATPPLQRHTEILLLQTKLYCESYIKLALHGAVGDDLLYPGIFCNTVDAALSLLERGKAEEGWRMLDEASDSVKSLFASKDKSILRLLLRFTQRWHKSATPMLFKVLWTHISDMASTILSDNSPITLVCVSITHMGSGYEVCETAFGLMLSEFEQSLGPDHEKALEIKELYISLLLESKNFDAAELLQRQLLHHYEHINEYSHSSVWAAYGLGLVLEKKGDFQGAEEAYRSASQRGSICNGERFPTQDDVYVLQHLVRMLSRRNKYAEGEALLAQALNMCLENNGGPTDCRMELILEEQDEIAWEKERIREAGFLSLEFMDVI